ncbi:c-type cytochrome [Flavihumibacter fluvii]|uniref:c-type cytochrome n=1 Tax=Flavihumibacter fluvii TaxID=2838157 RepID=UPI001BDEA438|nr:c-type cytochrome [Flavihumibacter fluvii]ULQ54065.1 c-type cytochrome [Flavihumibacter fluvii]
MKLPKYSWFLLCLCIITVVWMLIRSYPIGKQPKAWHPPDFSSLGFSGKDSLIRYGKDLFTKTSYYLGPKGQLANMSNGMDCQNCHEAAGTKNFSNCLSAAAATYPKFRDRSGRVESISFRVNECLERSLNGRTLDTTGLEMQAVVAYIQWLGKDVPLNKRPEGAGTADLPFLHRAANPEQGKMIYQEKCMTCHGANGGGLLLPDSVGYVYPPLWGPNSFNTSAGLFRISKLAAFIKDNMPLGATHDRPALSNEAAWDLAAYISSQPRPQKFFPYDWPVISTKPFDYPFAPFADSFSEQRHKFGPFGQIAKIKKPR